MSRLHRLLQLAAVAALLTRFLPSLQAQTTTGQISGSVVDTTAQVIVNAKVTLRNEGTGDRRTTTTNETGAFVFPALVPGTYAVRVESEGFNATEQTGIVLTANERRALGNLELKVGSVSESISVQAENVQIQTTSTENSQLLSTRQMDQLQTKGLLSAQCGAAGCVDRHLRLCNAR